MKRKGMHTASLTICKTLEKLSQMQQPIADNGITAMGKVSNKKGGDAEEGERKMRRDEKLKTNASL